MVKNHPFTVISGGLSGQPSGPGQFRTACPSALSGNDFEPDDAPITITLSDHVRAEMESLYGPPAGESFNCRCAMASGDQPSSFLGRFLFGWGANPDGSSDIHP